MPNASVDAVVTDPPYGVGFKYATHNDKRDGYEHWCLQWFTEIRRVCRGPMAITVGQVNLSVWARIAPPDWWMAWWKPAAMGRCVVGFNNWEPIALYGKPRRAGCDVVRACIKPSEDVGNHPCPKPIEWALKQVELLTDDGATVLDPFAGSGTTGVACVETGRAFIGVEMDAGYVEIAKARIADAERRHSENLVSA
jgi:site-specific DNA-methyltransferase (adenine-specific)